MDYHRLALLGDPVEHSRSPEIHRVLLELSGLRGEYTTVRSGRSGLAEAISGLHDGSWQGLNVTMPLKGDAAELAERLAPESSRSLSVNTLVLSKDVVVGHSTDTVALTTLVADSRFDQCGPIHILGAGGSAAAALAALPPDVAVYLSARRPDAARALVARMATPTASHGFAEWGVLPWGTAVVGALVVNTTPVGMAGETLPVAVLESAGGLIDLPYDTDPTPAAVFAAHRDLPFADGHEFLVRQAIASFRLWTGVEPPYARVVARLRKP